VSERERICGECWYSAWVPVATEAECNLTHPHDGGHDRCDYCWLKGQWFAAEAVRREGERVHPLKCWPPYFAEVLAGRKPFEVRKNDRVYLIGDLLLLREFDPAEGKDGAYTGRMVERRVTYVLAGGSFGIALGYVVLGLADPAALARPADAPAGGVNRDDVLEALRLRLMTYRETADPRPFADWIMDLLALAQPAPAPTDQAGVRERAECCGCICGRCANGHAKGAVHTAACIEDADHPAAAPTQPPRPQGECP
jgi:hypothetical protein